MPVANGRRAETRCMPSSTAISHLQIRAAADIAVSITRWRYLRDTGCYADMTLPSAPDQSQVAVINQIYECGDPLDERGAASHAARVSPQMENKPQLPLIFTGPLVFNWTRRIKGMPVPRIDDGALTANQALDAARFRTMAVGKHDGRGQERLGVCQTLLSRFFRS